MAIVSEKEFFKEYGRALLSGEGALFAGAGLSVPAGMADWRTLLKDIADSLDLDVDQDDLIALAQYEYNHSKTKNRLNRAIIEEFAKKAVPTATHTTLARLPLQVVWTTNYDKLIETAFEDAGRRPDVKYAITQLATRRPYSEVTIFKMHGDVDHPNEAVITKDDYELYWLDRKAFVERLTADLTTHTFLFLGFSFTDPNIEFILSRLRVILKGNSRPHYCVMRRPIKAKGISAATFKREQSRFQHRVEDLSRFCIQTVVIDKYDEIGRIVNVVGKRVRGQNIFVSGSAYDFSPLSKARMEQFAYALGQSIISHGCNLVSGLGVGIGNACVAGVHEGLLHDTSSKLTQRLRLHPFPQTSAAKANPSDTYTRLRQEILQESGIAIFIAGNKLDAKTKRTIQSAGVLEEFEIACNQGVIPIPIPATGHAALEIWKRIEPKLVEFFGSAKVRTEFNTLSNPACSNKDWINAIFSIITKTVATRKS